jgi:hypothetical protein
VHNIHKKTDISLINAMITSRSCKMIKIPTGYFASDRGYETVITL